MKILDEAEFRIKMEGIGIILNYFRTIKLGSETSSLSAMPSGIRFLRLKEGRLVNLNQEAVLSLRDLARVYDYSQDYLRNLINRGSLKAHKKGKLWYVRVYDLAQYVNTLLSKADS